MYFSPSLNRFYQPEWEQDYVAAGDWPSDLTEVTDAVFTEFTEYRAGYVRGVVDGNPAWVEASPLTIAQQISIAVQKKAELLATAKSTISLWQTELLLGAISDDDKASLMEWVGYIKKLQALDFSNIADADGYDGIPWPEKPDQ
ncbi:tail fiber assembly protein [Escherichia coli]|nr:tail fiber assembly protein [Escherichia coli]SQY55137.1 tail fiber assembly protein [Escherichia coli]SQY97590.1 tail fiber assembly protein [Escherichia coli]STH76705.1 tail fiber assembly protein [Escherichia coli]